MYVQRPKGTADSTEEKEEKKVAQHPIPLGQRLPRTDHPGGEPQSTQVRTTVYSSPAVAGLHLRYVHAHQTLHSTHLAIRCHVPPIRYLRTKAYEMTLRCDLNPAVYNREGPGGGNRERSSRQAPVQVRAGKGSCCSPPHTVWMIRGAEYVGARGGPPPGGKGRGERGGCERSERRVSGSPRSQPWGTSKRNRIVCGPESRTVVALSTSPPPPVSRSPCRQPYRVTVRTGTGVIDWDSSLSLPNPTRDNAPRGDAGAWLYPECGYAHCRSSSPRRNIIGQHSRRSSKGQETIDFCFHWRRGEEESAASGVFIWGCPQGCRHGETGKKNNNDARLVVWSLDSCG